LAVKEEQQEEENTHSNSIGVGAGISASQCSSSSNAAGGGNGGDMNELRLKMAALEVRTTTINKIIFCESDPRAGTFFLDTFSFFEIPDFFEDFA
jgi:hypothetical protein